MPKITFLPSGKSVQARVGQALIPLARSLRLIIPQRCGGHASCQMCRVIVEQGNVSPPTNLERRKMAEADLAQGVRLACQVKTTGQSCVIRIPDSKLKSVVASLLDKQKQNQDNI